MACDWFNKQDLDICDVTDSIDRVWIFPANQNQINSSFTVETERKLIVVEGNGKSHD